MGLSQVIRWPGLLRPSGDASLPAPAAGTAAQGPSSLHSAVRRGTLAPILRQAGLTSAEFLKLLD
jgi:hypothetical protein